MTTPVTKAARHARVVELLTRHPVHSQGELAKLLADEGLEVTQATLSRDLVEIGAVKLRTQDGTLIYAVPGEGGERIRKARAENAETFNTRLVRLAQELLVSAEALANLVIAPDPTGAAQYLASAIDHAEWPSILGTVAGDDSILVITSDPAGGQAVAHALLKLTERRGQGPRRPASTAPSRHTTRPWRRS